MRGKPWSVEEEKQLKALVEAKNSVSVIAKKLSKTGDAVVQKCYRLSLEVEGVKKNNSVPSSSNVGLKLPAELPSVEETLKGLSAALSALKRGGLDKVDFAVAQCYFWMQSLQGAARGLHQLSDY
jgi:hypothetical protein